MTRRDKVAIYAAVIGYDQTPYNKMKDENITQVLDLADKIIIEIGKRLDKQDEEARGEQQ